MKRGHTSSRKMRMTGRQRIEDGEKTAQNPTPHADQMEVGGAAEAREEQRARRERRQRPQA